MRSFLALLFRYGDPNQTVMLAKATMLDPRFSYEPPADSPSWPQTEELKTMLYLEVEGLMRDNADKNSVSPAQEDADKYKKSGCLST